MDGTEATRYEQCFRVYSTWEESVLDVLRRLSHPLVAAALGTGNLRLVADAMREDGYFTAPAELYAKALWNNAQPVAKKLGEPLAVFLDAPQLQDAPQLRDATDGAEGGGGGIAVLTFGGLLFASFFRRRR
jgi:hypothetical protein